MSGKNIKDVKSILQEQLKSKVATKLVDSPYAKYNSRGQLMCIVCGVPVKSAIIWQAHVNKRSHLESLVKLKQKQKQLNSNVGTKSASSSSPFKRPASPPPLQQQKKKATDSKIKPKGILKKISTYSDSDSGSEDENEDKKPKIEPPVVTEGPHPEDQKPDINQLRAANNGLPEDFFDNEGQKEEKENLYNEKEEKPKAAPKPNTSEVLPEGFFDDPVADAKARKVEYKDKDAEEWTAFLREVSQAEVESRLIIEEDKEEAALETQIEQANEQIACLERVVELDKTKKNKFQERTTIKKEIDDDASSDEDFAPVIWRTKNSLI